MRHGPLDLNCRPEPSGGYVRGPSARHTWPNSRLRGSVVIRLRVTLLGWFPGGAAVDPPLRPHLRRLAHSDLARWHRRRTCLATSADTTPTRTTASGGPQMIPARFQ